MADRYYYEYEDAGAYCYPGTHVLVNLLGIHDPEEFADAERTLTALNVQDILENPVKGVFDFRHLKAIHKAVFGDIFAWAGQMRTVNIAKGNQFCHANYIESYAKTIFDELEAEEYLVNTPPDEMPTRLAYYLGKINVLHPFREGNGRVQRVLIEYLAKVAGYDVDFSDISAAEMIQASAEAFDEDYTKMTALFRKAIQPTSMEEQRDFVHQLTGKRGPVFLAWHKKHLNS